MKRTTSKCCLTVSRSTEKWHGTWGGASVACVWWLSMQHVSEIWWSSIAIAVVAQTSYFVWSYFVCVYVTGVQRSDFRCVVILVDIWKAQAYSSCLVLCPLQVGWHIMSRTKLQWVAVVNSWQGKSRYKCDSCSTCQESMNRCQWRSSVKYVRAMLETCTFMVRRQSNVKPKFFTDCLKTIWAFSIVIEVGRLWRCIFLLEVTSMSSVLS